MATYDYMTSLKNTGRKVQVESANRDGSGKNIENNYAKMNGSYSEMQVGMASQISSTLPNTHTETFSYQTSAGSADIGSGVAEVQKLLGNSYVLNQYISDSFAPANSIVGYTSTKTNGVIHVTGSVLVTSTNSSNMLGSYRLIGGHKYAFISDIKQTSNIIYKVAIWNYTASAWYQIISWNTIYTASTEIVEGVELYFNMGASSIGDTIDDYLTLNVIDLTQMFGAGNEPATIAEFKALFPQDYIPYNTGEIIDSCPVQYNTVGYNQWDEDWEVGYIQNDGTLANWTSNIRSKNYIKCLPNTNYYFYVGKSEASIKRFYYDYNKNLISFSWGKTAQLTPANAAYMKFTTDTAYGGTYLNDICLFIYWDGSKVTYEQYDAHSYPLPGITLRSAKNYRPDNGDIDEVKDELLPDGTLIRKVAQKTIADADISTTEPVEYTNISYWVIVLGSDSVSSYFKCATIEGYGSGIIVPSAGGFDSTAWIGTINVNANSNKLWAGFPKGTTRSEAVAALAGKKVNYEIEPTTTSTGTSYQVNTIIDDFGTQEIVDDSGDIIPGRMQIKYPVNLQGFLESLYSLTNGDPEAIQLVE